MNENVGHDDLLGSVWKENCEAKNSGDEFTG